MLIMKVENDTAHHRFLVRLPEGEGELVYNQLTPRTLELVHTEVDPKLRGHGVAEAIAEAAIRHARGHGMRIVPTCPYVKRWLEKHPEHNDLVVARSSSD
jgi:predicted GNAT family acetyltransferase